MSATRGKTRLASIRATSSMSKACSLAISARSRGCGRVMRGVRVVLVGCGRHEPGTTAQYFNGERKAKISALRGAHAGGTWKFLPSDS